LKVSKKKIGLLEERNLAQECADELEKMEVLANRLGIESVLRQCSQAKAHFIDSFPDVAKARNWVKSSLPESREYQMRAAKAYTENGLAVPSMEKWTFFNQWQMEPDQSFESQFRYMLDLNIVAGRELQLEDVKKTTNMFEVNLFWVK